MRSLSFVLLIPLLLTLVLGTAPTTSADDTQCAADDTQCNLSEACRTAEALLKKIYELKGKISAVKIRCNPDGSRTLVASQNIRQGERFTKTPPDLSLWNSKDVPVSYYKKVHKDSSDDEVFLNSIFLHYVRRRTLKKSTQKFLIDAMEADMGTDFHCQSPSVQKLVKGTSFYIYCLMASSKELDKIKVQMQGSKDSKFFSSISDQKLLQLKHRFYSRSAIAPMEQQKDKKKREVAGLFPFIVFSNHATDNNAKMAEPLAKSLGDLEAVKDIPAGAEITINYFGVERRPSTAFVLTNWNMFIPGDHNDILFDLYPGYKVRISEADVSTVDLSPALEKVLQVLILLKSNLKIPTQVCKHHRNVARKILKDIPLRDDEESFEKLPLDVASAVKSEIHILERLVVIMDACLEGKYNQFFDKLSKSAIKNLDMSKLVEEGGSTYHRLSGSLLETAKELYDMEDSEI